MTNLPRSVNNMDEEKKLKLRNELKVSLYIIKEGLIHLEESIKAFYDLIGEQEEADENEEIVDK